MPKTQRPRRPLLSPLGEPPSLPQTTTSTSRYRCKYCDWTTNNPSNVEIHESMYHEAVVAREGERAREGGRDYGEFCVEEDWDKERDWGCWCWDLEGIPVPDRADECPYLGCWCPSRGGIPARDCRGYDECFRKGAFPLPQVALLKELSWAKLGTDGKLKEVTR